jgi:HSP20 family protein
MNLRSLVPFRDRASLARPELGVFGSLQREVDRLFEDFARGVPALGTMQTDGNLIPSIDVSETDKEIEITAELPGLERNDVEITVDNDVLTIRGEKKIEADQPGKDASKAGNENRDNKNYHVTERSYGVFLRVLQLPASIDPSKVEATMAKGVLRIKIPKPARPEAKKIEVKEAA